MHIRRAIRCIMRVSSVVQANVAALRGAYGARLEAGTPTVLGSSPLFSFCCSTPMSSIDISSTSTRTFVAAAGTAADTVMAEWVVARFITIDEEDGTTLPAQAFRHPLLSIGSLLALVFLLSSLPILFVLVRLLLQYFLFHQPPPRHLQEHALFPRGSAESGIRICHFSNTTVA